MPRNFSMQAIESKWSQQRLDKMAMSKLSMPWSDVHKYVREKEIFVAKGGKDVAEADRYVTKQTGYKLEFGDILCISDRLLSQIKARQKEVGEMRGPQTFSKDKTKRMAAKFESMVLFENDEVLVINKPCGVPSQQGTALDPQKTASVDVLGKAYAERHGKEVYLVHRLDRSASGLMCLAKSREMARVLSAEMSAQRLTKEYTALLSNYSTFFPCPPKGVIRQSLDQPAELPQSHFGSETTKQ